jgi:Argininosuccinate lyase
MYFGNLDLGTLREFSQKFESDIFDFILPQTSVARKQSAGSTSPQEVKKQSVHWTRVLSKRRI